MITKPIESDENLVMYFIVRESLNMSVGKIAAQCCHGLQYILSEYYQWIQYVNSLDDGEQKNKTLRMCYWLTKNLNNGGYKKVILRASDNEWEKIKQELLVITVKDAGLTEIAAGSETVLTLYPMYKEERPKILKRLQVL